MKPRPRRNEMKDPTDYRMIGTRDRDPHGGKSDKREEEEE
jgi:hypothetical protein